MQEWLVEWRMHIDAEDPTDAAERAMDALTREGSIAHVFTVTVSRQGQPVGDSVTVDLDDDEQDGAPTTLTVTYDRNGESYTRT